MAIRIKYIDALKGLAIVLMVMGHALAWNYGIYKDLAIVYDDSQTLSIKIGGVIGQLIYSFHMALFFMVSGFLIFRLKIDKVAEYFRKKSLRLLLPWICTFGYL